MKKILDFYADWCVPCKALEPHLKAAETREVKIERINVEKELDAARLFGISALPTLLFFNGQKIVAALTGASPETIAQIQAFSGD